MYALNSFRWEDGGRVRRGHTAQDQTERCTNHSRRVYYSTTTYRASAPHSSLKWLRKPFVGFTPVDFRGGITGATERPLLAASPSEAFFFEELPPMVSVYAVVVLPLFLQLLVSPDENIKRDLSIVSLFIILAPVVLSIGR